MDHPPGGTTMSPLSINPCVLLYKASVSATLSLEHETKDTANNATAAVANTYFLIVYMSNNLNWLLVLQTYQKIRCGK